MSACLFKVPRPLDCCNCEYCSANGKARRKNSKSNQNLTDTLVSNSLRQQKQQTSTHLLARRSQSFASLNEFACSQKWKLKRGPNNVLSDKLSKAYDYDHELIGPKSSHHLCFYYYNLWQGEVFKARAFEKHNERLESRVKYLENKLERETLQQIRISLEWRKNVTQLVDENTKLKMATSSTSKLLNFSE